MVVGGQGRHQYSRGWHPRHKNVPVDSFTRWRIFPLILDIGRDACQNVRAHRSRGPRDEECTRGRPHSPPFVSSPKHSTKQQPTPAVDCSSAIVSATLL
jgi:hypothetical protein